MPRTLSSLTCLALLNLSNAQWLDPTFGSGGLVDISLNAAYDGAFSTMVQPDGKIVIAGSIAGNGGYDFLVARYLSDGTLDMDFGTGGFATHHERAQDFGRDLALQADGGIVVVGTATGGGSDKVVMRFTAAGLLDPDFGNGGTVIIDGSSVDDALWGVAVQPDQQIVIVGQGFNGTHRTFYIARLNSDGGFDPTFGNDGEYEHLIGSDFCWAQDVVVMDDGRIVAGGSSYTTGVSVLDAAVVRYLANGTLDNGFGSGGKVVIPWSPQTDGGNALAVQTDGRIVVAGYEGGNPAYITASRLLANGTLDPDFGVNGTVRTYSGVSPTRCGALAIDASDRILMAGSAVQDGTQRSSYLCRLLPDGTLDADFGAMGELIHGAPGVFEETPAIALQEDGRIILAGITGAGTSINVRLIRYVAQAVTGIAETTESALQLLSADRSGVELLFPFERSAQFLITSMTGSAVQRGQVNALPNTRAHISFSDELSEGTYLLTMSSDGRSITARFVILGR